MANFQYSKRGQQVQDFPNFMLKYCCVLLDNPYNPSTNPEGFLNLGIAENTLCGDILTDKLRTPELNTYEEYMQYYFQFRGLKSFRTKVAAFLEERFNSVRPIDPEKVIITAGAGAGLDLLGHMLCDPGDCCLVFAPYYAAISADLGIRAQIECITVQLKSSSANGHIPFEIDMEETEQAIVKAQSEGKRVKMATILNPHNPTGDILSRDRIIELLELFKRYNMHVIMDEVYALSVLDEGTSFTSVLSLPYLPCPEKTHFVWGFAKDFGLSGFRCGIVYTLNPTFSAAATHLLYMAAVPSLIQNKLGLLISDKEWLDETYFPENRNRLKSAYEYFRKRLTAIGAKIHEPKAGLFIWADFRQLLPEATKEEEMKLFEEFMAARVYCVPGTSLFFEEAGWFRFTFALKREYMKTGISRVESVMEKRRRLQEQKTEPEEM